MIIRRGDEFMTPMAEMASENEGAVLCCGEVG